MRLLLRSTETAVCTQIVEAELFAGTVSDTRRMPNLNFSKIGCSLSFQINYFRFFGLYTCHLLLLDLLCADASWKRMWGASVEVATALGFFASVCFTVQ